MPTGMQSGWIAGPRAARAEREERRAREEMAREEREERAAQAAAEALLRGSRALPCWGAASWRLTGATAARSGREGEALCLWEDGGRATRRRLGMGVRSSRYGRTRRWGEPRGDVARPEPRLHRPGGALGGGD